MAAFLLAHNKNRFPNIIHNLYYTEVGASVVSLIFGIAVVFLFQKACKGAHCYIYKSPPEKDIKGIIFENPNDGCYTYRPKVVPCEENRD